ncbi:hypothetical protein [Demequina litorisediminis]|uniref:hypothetical protein n=1 Tax=Demequina litorisediminis TaxID=1849022 RepID=UPI0024E17722|nr:hypothetical protein [Demequina litorisediminis]
MRRPRWRPRRSPRGRASRTSSCSLRDDHLSAGEIAMLLNRSVRDVQGMIRAARSAPIAAPAVEHSVDEPAPAYEGSVVSDA